MTLSSGNIFRVIDTLWGESSGELSSQRPVMRSFAALFDVRRKKSFEETVEMPSIWDAMVFIVI